ncbi:hypothetical protein L1987_77967 [Smallanthus sonchifolius]|uniref:Uncharacterized protein n=1 Tax=Smallanthus sonchifolius TaxID=185202 RepID=A0ACB8ZCF1_9ASTR|nr:hypothetical protein L1987_77967 [Smallanthus sonchifolius]
MNSFSRGLNTLGVSMARIDYAPGGLNPPHTHPRATEIVFVLEGALDVGFITTDNKLFSKTIKKGEIFTFPRGLIHFQINNGKVPAAVIAGFNSQLPGTQRVADALFTSSPTVNDVVLTKAFQVGTEVVEKIKSKFALKKTCDNVGALDVGFVTIDNKLFSKTIKKAMIGFIDVAGLYFALTQLTHRNISQNHKYQAVGLGESLITCKLTWDYILQGPEANANLVYTDGRPNISRHGRKATVNDFYGRAGLTSR